MFSARRSLLPEVSHLPPWTGDAFEHMISSSASLFY